jgi:hypothetical protein
LAVLPSLFSFFKNIQIFFFVHSDEIIPLKLLIVLLLCIDAGSRVLRKALVVRVHLSVRICDPMSVSLSLCVSV